MNNDDERDFEEERWQREDYYRQCAEPDEDGGEETEDYRDSDPDDVDRDIYGMPFPLFL